ncbi:MAG: phosphoribosylglycinamide formyltransferase [Arenicella sp.]|nr:phosphoribosylglycinamide formyltransferase [Arenicella sp.]
MTKAVILISGSGSNLQAFIDSVAAGELPVSIELVISNNADAYGLQRARLAGIATDYIDHRNFASRAEFDQAMMDRIDLAEPDIVILAGFMRIFTAEFVEHYSERLVNIHPSLLPKFPGTNTHRRAIDAAEKWHGVTIHFVVPEVDAGPIILQGRIPIRHNDTPESLQQRIHRVEHRLYPLAVKWFAEKRLSVQVDKVLLDGERSDMQLQSFDL